MPTITHERHYPGLRVVEAHDLGAVLAVLRPNHGDVLVVVDQETPAAMLRGIARPILPDDQRRLLSRFLDLRRKR